MPKLLSMPGTRKKAPRRPLPCLQIISEAGSIVGNETGADKARPSAHAYVPRATPHRGKPPNQLRLRRQIRQRDPVRHAKSPAKFAQLAIDVVHARLEGGAGRPQLEHPAARTGIPVQERRSPDPP